MFFEVPTASFKGTRSRSACFWVPAAGVEGTCSVFLGAPRAVFGYSRRVLEVLAVYCGSPAVCFVDTRSAFWGHPH